MILTNYDQMLKFIPQKRVDVPGDLQDPKRYGPGHLNSLDELRKQVRAEVQARKKAQAPPYNSKSESASSVVTDRQSAKARARSHDGLPSSSTALRVMALPNSAAQQETAAETAAGATIAATIAAAETEAGAGPEAEPSTEALTDATRNAEEKADSLLASAEHAIRTIHPVAAQNLTNARQLLADTGRGTVTAAMALGCISHTLPQIPRNAAHRNTLEAVERNCRDVLVWRCQLRLGPGNIRRRDVFLGELQTAVAEARDAAAAAQSDASSAEAAGDANSWALRGRVAALPFLQQAASGGMPGQKFVSQALHAHRTEVSTRFPGTFLSNCQRAPRRSRPRNQRPGPRSQPEATPEANQNASAEEYDYCFDVPEWHFATPPDAEALTHKEPVVDFAAESCNSHGFWNCNRDPCLAKCGSQAHWGTIGDARPGCAQGSAASFSAVGSFEKCDFPLWGFGGFGPEYMKHFDLPPSDLP